MAQDNLLHGDAGEGINMRVIYMAGPYRSTLGEWYVHKNIEEARAVARELWLMGAAVICPHANTAMFGGTTVPDDVWLKGDLEILSRCDAVVALPRWSESKGATGEVEQAHLQGKPVFRWPEEKPYIERWLSEY